MAHILIVDDDEIIRTLLKELLVQEGHQVSEAADGNQALASQLQNSAELVILDILMPNKEGIETIIELRQAQPELKIIAISGGGRNRPNDYLIMAASFGAQRTLVKPFTKSELFTAVNSLI